MIDDLTRKLIFVSNTNNYQSFIEKLKIFDFEHTFCNLYTITNNGIAPKNLRFNRQPIRLPQKCLNKQVVKNDVFNY